VIWIIVALSVVAGAVGALYLLNGPLFHRNRELAFVEEFARTFASMAQGSVLIVEHDGSDRFLQFRKPADTGTALQNIVFGFPDVKWSRGYFDSVVAALRSEGFTFDVTAQPNDAGPPVRFAEAFLYGDREGIGREARRLATTVAPAIEFDEAARFTFHIEGSEDPAIGRRLKETTWVAMAESESAVARFYGRRQLKKLRQETTGG
jgi:hypothetical protein